MSWTFGPALQLLALLGFFTAAPVIAAPDIEVCFTPEYSSTPSCTQDIVNAIASARHSILVQAYSFTSASIAKALIEAHRRGVAVKAILAAGARTQFAVFGIEGQWQTRPQIQEFAQAGASAGWWSGCGNDDLEGTLREMERLAKAVVG